MTAAAERANTEARRILTDAIDDIRMRERNSLLDLGRAIREHVANQARGLVNWPTVHWPYETHVDESSLFEGETTTKRGAYLIGFELSGIGGPATFRRAFITPREFVVVWGDFDYVKPGKTVENGEEVRFYTFDGPMSEEEARHWKRFGPNFLKLLVGHIRYLDSGLIREAERIQDWKHQINI